MHVESDKLSQLFSELKLRSEPPGEYDLAEWNLILAQGLPGGENIDTEKLLCKLDDWADIVRCETERQYYRFIKSPSDYENSLGYFLVLVLITVLERDLGVQYNPKRVRDPKFQDPHCIDPDFSDSRDTFIHGILDGPGGTCSSMPVVYTAVGRRLGYPIKLVSVPGHLLCRWDDPDGSFNGIPDRFNIAASGHGFANLPDEYFKTWPREWTEQEEELGFYLKSQTQAEEIAGFLATRSFCLEDNNRLLEAFMCLHWAYQLTHDKRYFNHAGRLRELLMEKYRKSIETEEMYRRAMRDRRRRSLQEKKPSPKARQTVRKQPLQIRDVGHGSHCQCLNCKKSRGDVLAKQNGDFGHGPSCQCLACRDNRQIVSSANGKPDSHRPVDV